MSSENDFAILRPVAITDTGAFSRASIGTYWDAAGVLQTAAVNEPRFNHDPVTHASLGLLMELASTNMLLHSNVFDDAYWQKTRSSVVPNAITALDGTNTGYKLVEDATVNNNHYLGKVSGLTLVSGISYVFSIPVKAAERTVVALDFFGLAGAACTFDLIAGTVAQGSAAAAARMTVLGGGRYLLEAAWTFSGTGAGPLMYPVVGGTPIYTGDGVSGVYVLGDAQLEVGTVATSRIRTTTAAVTRAADVNTAKLVSNVAEPAVVTNPDPALWAAATAYAVGDRAYRPTTHRIYQRAVAGTTATAPELDTVNWVDAGPTNRWAMFDLANESQTTKADELVVVLTPGEVVDSLGFINLDANSVRVQVAGTSYDQTIQLKTRDVGDWWDYFVEPFTFKTEAVFTGLPPLTTNVITVTISKPGSVAAVGSCIVGLSKVIGGTQYGASAGILDYSRKVKDDFGNTSVVERPYSKRMNVSLFVDNTNVDEIQRTLASYRAKPLLFIGAGNLFDALVVYGFYISFEIVVAYPTSSMCSMEIEGLT